VAGSHVEAVESLAEALEAGGFEPVLVGGMALVVLGSRRVTRDFDFLVTTGGAPLGEIVRVMYRHRLELVTKLNKAGEAIRTVDQARVAAAKVETDPPQILFFYDGRTGLKVDLLIDHPLPAHAVARRAIPVRLASRRIPVASPEDLLRMNEIASTKRTSASDAQDLQFLRALLSDRRGSPSPSRR
jgi:hypothetical protein